MAILGQGQSCWSGAVLAFGQGPQLACEARTAAPAKAVRAAGQGQSRWLRSLASCEDQDRSWQVSLTSASSLGNLSSAAAILTFVFSNDEPSGASDPDSQPAMMEFRPLPLLRSV